MLSGYAALRAYGSAGGLSWRSSGGHGGGTRESPGKDDCADDYTGMQTGSATAGSAASTQTQAVQTAGAAVQSTDANSAKAQALINKAEASFSSGVTNYRANRLDAARMDFDFAVDTMLSSGMDLKRRRSAGG